jgi:hypothetical protein
MAGPKKKKKLKKKDTPKKRREELMESIERVREVEAAAPTEVWMMGDEVYETTDEDRKRMSIQPEEAMAGGGKVMRYYNEGGGVYGYFHGEDVDKNKGQYDIQVKKIKGKGKVL